MLGNLELELRGRGRGKVGVVYLPTYLPIDLGVTPVGTAHYVGGGGGGGRQW